MRLIVLPVPARHSPFLDAEHYSKWTISDDDQCWIELAKIGIWKVFDLSIWTEEWTPVGLSKRPTPPASRVVYSASINSC